LGVPLGGVGADPRQPGQLLDPPASLAQQVVALVPHSWPVVLGLEVDGRRNGEVGGRVARALPLVLQHKRETSEVSETSEVCAPT
jgi:hypothetical protein